jgi:putative spermidine/putrescine transport system permease protein
MAASKGAVREGRPASFYWLAAFFGAFVLFLYGPMIAIFVLSFQGPTGGLTFPLRGLSVHWFEKLWDGGGIVDIKGAFVRSAFMSLTAMVLTVVLSVLAGLAVRKRFRFQNLLFYVTVASLIVPSIVTSLGIALQFRIIDDAWKTFAPETMTEGFGTTMGLYTSGLGAHLTWTLPFGLLIIFAIFNRFDSRLEEAARDQGATPWQTFRFVILPIILPSLVGVGLFGFTLSWDEIARSSQSIGEKNTLPLELQALTTTVTTPEIYALGTVTTGVSFLVIGIALLAIMYMRARQAGRGSDAGKGMV